MAREIINVGTVPNDGTGDPIRTAYIKCNDNFAELYSRAQTSVPSSPTGSPGDVAGMYAADSSTFYWCFQDYDGSSAIWGETPNAQITALINGSSNVSVADSANVTVSVGGQSNIAVFSSALATLANVLIPGTLSVTGNAVFADVLPAADLAHDLGSADLRWRSLYLGGNTIFLGNAEISSTGDDLVFTAPDGSEFTIGGGGPSGQATGQFGDVIASGNITAGVFVGDGQFLTNITTVSNVAVSQIANAASVLSLAGASLPFTFTVAGVANVAVVTATGIQTSQLIANGNIQSGNVITTGLMRAGTAEIQDSTQSTSVSTGALVITGGLGVGDDVNIGGDVVVAGNVSADYVLGNGSQLTGISVDSTSIANGTSSVAVISSGGNILANVSGSTVQLLSSGGATITGFVSATGNVSGGNVSTTGNIGCGNLTATGTVTAANIDSVNADVAELYVSDAVYAPGTVMSFGGAQEVTQSMSWGDTAIAGVVSDRPSYLMNSGLSGHTVLPIALLGRVRCQVTGIVKKGQLLISDGQGGACAAKTDPRSGSVVGKSLQDFDGDRGMIEIAVGRL